MIATVVVSTDPIALDEDRSPPTTVFLVADRGAGTDEAITTTDQTAAVELGEVICRGDLAVLALQHLKTGQEILVAGELTSRPALGPSLDAAAVTLAIEAAQIGMALRSAVEE